MSAGSDKVQVVTIEPVHEEPIRFDVALAATLPIAGELVIAEPRWKGLRIAKQRRNIAQLRRVLSAFLGEFHIAAELATVEYGSHVLDS